MNKKKTHEEFIGELKLKNPNIEIIGDYINGKTKILCKCKIDGTQWFIVAGDLIYRNRGCPKCAKEEQKKRQTKTHEQFMMELNEVNKNIEIIGEYKTAKIKILCKCKIDRHEWEVLPINLIRGHGCPLCASNKHTKKMTKTHNEFITEMNIIHPDILVLGEYKKAKAKIKLQCKKDGYKWETTPGVILRDSSKGCPKCSGNIKNKSNEHFVNELYEISENIIVHGEYINSKTKIDCQCKVCNYKWKTVPSSLLAGHGCPQCSSSKGELSIIKFLNQNYIRYKHQHNFKGCKHERKLYFDFYLPTLNVAIEYQGIQHYQVVKHFGGEQGFKQRSKRDKIKEDWCKLNNIKLIEIPYTVKDIGKYLEEHLELNKLQLSIL